MPVLNSQEVEINMTPFYLVLLGTVSTVLLGMVLGVIARCAQEQYHPEAWFIAIMVIPIHLLLIVVLPLIAPFRVFFSDHFKKLKIPKRAFWSLCAIPVGVVFVVGGFKQITDEALWAPLSELNKKIIEHLRKRSPSTIVVQDVIQRSIGLPLNIVNERVWSLCMAR